MPRNLKMPEEPKKLKGIKTQQEHISESYNAVNRDFEAFLSSCKTIMAEENRTIPACVETHRAVNRLIFSLHIFTLDIHTKKANVV